MISILLVFCCFWGVNEVCLRSPPAYKHPTVCRMGLPAHGLAFGPLPVCKLRYFAHGLAFVPLPVSRMRHSAHGTRDKSPHRDTSTAAKTCLGMRNVSNHVFNCFAGVNGLCFATHPPPCNNIAGKTNPASHHTVALDKGFQGFLYSQLP